MNKLTLLLIALIISTTVISQTSLVLDSLSDGFNHNKNDNYVIPELSVCIDSALNNSPLLKATQPQIDAILEDIKINRKTWLDYFLIDGHVRYGLYNQLTLTQQTANPDIAIQSDKTQLNYFAGITLRLPFSYFTNNKNERRKLESNIQVLQFKHEELKQEIIKVVVKEYFTLKRLQESITVHLNNLQTAQLDLLKSKNDIKSGMISTTEYAASSGGYTKAFDAFLSVKNEYYTQYHILNILIGTNLQNQKK